MTVLMFVGFIILIISSQNLVYVNIHGQNNPILVDALFPYFEGNLWYFKEAKLHKNISILEMIKC